jgi:hypothetical protein
MSVREERAGRAYRSDDETARVPDPYIPNRMVSNKRANRPFLAYVVVTCPIKPGKLTRVSARVVMTCNRYKEYRDHQEALHEAWVARNKEREEKVARGEEVGPPEPDPTAVQEFGTVDLLRFLLYALVIALLAGKFFTGDYLWEYRSKWTRLNTYFPVGIVRHCFELDIIFLKIFSLPCVRADGRR